MVFAFITSSGSGGDGGGITGAPDAASLCSQTQSNCRLLNAK